MGDADRKAGSGRVCHNPDRLGFSSTDNTDPSTNGKKYTIGLDPERSCEGAVWLYPKDAMRVNFPIARVSRMQSGASALRLEALDPATPDPNMVLAFKLLVDGEVRLDESLKIGAFEQGEHEWVLDPPVSPDSTSVTLEVSNPSQMAFLLLTSAVLSEHARGLGN